MLPDWTTWLWGTFALHAAGAIAGANFATGRSSRVRRRSHASGRRARASPLADIEFQRQAGGASAPWHIFSRDGRFDVTFEPEGRKQVRHQLGVFAIDYFQLFGTYRGTVRGADRSHAVEGAHGVCERMLARL